MKNTDTIKEFCNFGIDETIKTRHLYFEGDVLFSYGYHFPLCIRLKNGFLINKNSYSMTTATHKGHLIRGLTDCNTIKELEKSKNEGKYKNIIFKDTSELKTLLDENDSFRFMTIEELQKKQILLKLEN